MLDIIQRAVQLRRWATCRIDGSMSADDRAREVARFRQDSTVPLFLLSSQVLAP
jgi:SNF2 family DNA or RNA helicase